MIVTGSIHIRENLRIASFFTKAKQITVTTISKREIILEVFGKSTLEAKSKKSLRDKNAHITEPKAATIQKRENISLSIPFFSDKMRIFGIKKDNNRKSKMPNPQAKRKAKKEYRLLFLKGKVIAASPKTVKAIRQIE